MPLPRTAAFVANPVAAGGDGTVNEVAAALMGHGGLEPAPRG